MYVDTLYCVSVGYKENGSKGFPIVEHLIPSYGVGPITVSITVLCFVKVVTFLESATGSSLCGGRDRGLLVIGE